MPRNTLNSNGMNTGSNYQFGDKLIAPNFPRSGFDLSHLVTRDVAQSGLVFPIAVIEALPNSDYSISVDTLIKVLPQSVPLMSKQRVYTYAFYSRNADLWDKWKTFITKGYSGNEILFNPREVKTPGLTDVMIASNATNPLFLSASSADKYKIKHDSLGDYFGLPVGRPISNTNLSMAMPEMMYLRIWRDYFCNRNYYYNDKRILPDDDSRFRLTGFNGSFAGDVSIGSFIDQGDCLVYTDKYGLFSAGWNDSEQAWQPSKGMQYIDFSSGITVSGKSYSKAFVIAPFYHDYPDDYFVSALPWAQRGDTSVANGTAIDLGVTGRDFLDLFKSSHQVKSPLTDLPFYDSAGDFSSNTGWIGSLKYVLNSSADYESMGVLSDGTFSKSSSGLSFTNSDSVWGSKTGVSGFSKDFMDWISNNLVTYLEPRSNPDVPLGSGGQLTLEKLRELAVNQTIQEKMARTDGSYGEFGLTFFGERSKSATDYRPLFIGGNTHSIIFTEVLQTSASTDDSPLGTFGGHGVGVDNNGFLGRFHSDDYGYIMILGCIMPDVYYSQGLERMWTRQLQSDWFLPERAQLGMRPILNRELYIQAADVVDSDNVEVNTKLWAYQDIFDELRYRPNRVGGQMADINSESFSPFTQFRFFDKLPNYGQEFARADEVRVDYLQAPSESPYICDFDINIRCVEPLPYRARPASIVSM